VNAASLILGPAHGKARAKHFSLRLFPSLRPLLAARSSPSTSTGNFDLKNQFREEGKEEKRMALKPENRNIVNNRKLLIVLFLTHLTRTC